MEVRQAMAANQSNPQIILRRVVALEVAPANFPPFVFRLDCGHTLAVSGERIPPDELTPWTEVRCPDCEQFFHV
jgi:hypothetical protein